MARIWFPLLILIVPVLLPAPGEAGFPVSGPIPDPQWGTLPRDSYLGFLVDMRTVGVPTRDQALLAVGGKMWGLRPGEYSLQARLIARKKKDGPERQWVGELRLPPVAVRVTAEQLSPKAEKSSEPMR